jgi:hypothetical protein
VGCDPEPRNREHRDGEPDGETQKKEQHPELQQAHRAEWLAELREEPQPH